MRTAIDAAGRVVIPKMPVDRAFGRRRVVGTLIAGIRGRLERGEDVGTSGLSALRLIMLVLTPTVIFAIMGVAPQIRSRRYRDATRATGRIIDRTISSNGRGKTFQITFGWEVDGRSFRATQTVDSELFEACQSRADVRIRYLPHRPSHARLESTLW